MESKALNKVIYKDSFLILLNRIFISLSRILAVFIFSHQLSQSVLGVYHNFWVQFSAIFAISGLSIANFVVSYSPDKVVQIFKNLSPAKFIIGFGILAASGLLFGYLQSGSGVYFLLAFSFLIFNTISVALESVMIAFKHFKSLLLINVVYFILFVAAHLYVLQMETYSFNFLVSLLTLIAFLKVFFCVLMLKNDFSKNGNATELLDDKYKKFWRHLYVFDMIQILMAHSDKFVVSLVMSEATSAVYQNATYVTPLLSIVFSAVSSAAILQFSEAQGDLKKQTQILNNTGKLLSVIAFPTFFFLMFFAKEFITVFYSAQYLDAVPIFRMSLLMIPLFAFNFNILLQRHEKGFVINQGMILDIVCLLIFIYPCYQWLGLKGIPLSFTLATVCQLLFYLWHNQKILQTGIANIFPLKDWAQKIVVFGSLSFGLYWMFHHWIMLPVFGTFFISATCIGIAMLVFLNKETKFLKRK